MEIVAKSSYGPVAGAGRPEVSRQYATFFVGDLFLGINVTEVQEVLRHQEMTEVPLQGVPGVVVPELDHSA